MKFTGIVFCVVAVAEEETAGNLRFIDAFFFPLSPDTVFIILNQIGWGSIDLSRVQNYRFVLKTATKATT